MRSADHDHTARGVGGRWELRPDAGLGLRVDLGLEVRLELREERGEEKRGERREERRANSDQRTNIKEKEGPVVARAGVAAADFASLEDRCLELRCDHSSEGALSAYLPLLSTPRLRSTTVVWPACLCVS